jgi:hypothetical protein
MKVWFGRMCGTPQQCTLVFSFFHLLMGFSFICLFSQALRESNHLDSSSRVRFLGVCDARIALVSPGGGGIDSICSQTVTIPLPGVEKGGKKKVQKGVLAAAKPPFVVIDPSCLALDIDSKDDSFTPVLKVTNEGRSHSFGIISFSGSTFSDECWLRVVF